MSQEQVLQHQVVARTYRGQESREQEPEQFEHAFSIADLWRVRFAASQPIADVGECECGDQAAAGDGEGARAR